MGLPILTGQVVTADDLNLLGRPGTILRRDRLEADSAAPLTADAVTDHALTNLEVTAGRTYGFHLNTQVTGTAAVGRWRLECRVNAVVIGGFGFYRQEVAAASNAIVDGWVLWIPSVSAATDDVDVFANELSGTMDITLQATATQPRELQFVDFGVIP